MRKVLAFLLAALGLVAVCEAADTRQAAFAYKWDVDSDSLTYCVLAGQNGDPFGQPFPVTGTIKTTGSSVTLAEFADTNPFTGLAVGDVLLIETNPISGGQSTRATRTIVTATSVSAVDVDSAITLTGTGGHKFSYLKLTCGTAITNGWVRVSGATSVTLQSQYDQGDLATGFRARYECSLGGFALPVIVYPGETSDCGIGGSLATDRCNFGTPGETARLTISLEGSGFTQCRIGMARSGADASDAGANIEQVTAVISVTK